MKISVSSYSFSQLLKDGSLNQLSCIAAAKQLGFEAIEFTDLTPHDGSSVESYAKAIAQEAQRLELPIACYCVGADFIAGSEGNLDAEVERLRGCVDIARLLGAPVMRHDTSRGLRQTGKAIPFAEALPLMAEGCKRVTEYAKTMGVRTVTENHGFFSQDSQRVEQIINLVNDSNFGWLCDMGNFLCVDENPVTAVGHAAPYAFHVHAKDFHVKSGMLPNPGEAFFSSRGGNYLRGAIIGHGDVPIPQCLAILKKAGYNGFVSIEFEGIEPTNTALKAGLAYLKHCIAAL